MTDTIFLLLLMITGLCRAFAYEAKTRLNVDKLAQYVLACSLVRSAAENVKYKKLSNLY